MGARAKMMAGPDPRGKGIFAREEKRRDQDLHRDRIRKMKPVTNTAPPSAFPHLKNNLKREQQLEDRYRDIDRENKFLLDKMGRVLRSKSQPGLQVAAPASLTKAIRKKELTRIMKDNQAMLKRIQDIRPLYSIQHWAEEENQRQKLLQNCAHYPMQARRRSTSSSELVRLEREKSAHDADEDTVHKGERNLGDQPFLVEMQTDGRMLAVYAYDQKAKRTLELVVSKEEHRKLHKLCNGDYQQVATKLRLDENGSLVFTDLE